VAASGDTGTMGDEGTTGNADVGAGLPQRAACPATPTQLVDFDALDHELNQIGEVTTQFAADNTSVYFFFWGTLLRVPLQGGSFSTLLTGARDETEYNGGLVAISSAVVFHQISAGNDEEIVNVPKAGGQPTTLAMTHGWVSAFLANDSDIYFVDQLGLQTVPSTGGSVRVLSDAMPAKISGLAVVGSSVVVTTSDAAGASGAVLSVPIGGGIPTTLATQQPFARFPMACGSDVCWWTSPPYPANFWTGPTTAFIARLVNGKGVTTVSAPVGAGSLSFDGTDFFETVVCDGGCGTLVRIPASGGPAVTVAPADYAVVEGACVYFSTIEPIGLPSSTGIGGGIYAVSKSYADPMLQH
jgi:hypothetical protein